MSEETKTVWPEVGDRYRDNVGRILIVTEVNQVDKLYRNIVGVVLTSVDQEPYATDKVIFDAVWASGKQAPLPKNELEKLLKNPPKMDSYGKVKP